MTKLRIYSNNEPGIVLSNVKRAARVIASHAHRTPVTTSQKLDALSENQLFFKCENLQKCGAFKFRGAVNAISNLTPEQLVKGVVTHSSGNHAGALALAAQRFKTRAFIVMPENSVPVKRDAVLEYGGEVISCQATQADRESTASQVQKETGAIMIPPYDHPHIIAGQGTAVLELLQQVPNLDAVIAPVGGGGLLAGTAIAARGISPRIKVYGAEPAGADDAFRSLAANERLPQTNPNTIADGLLTGLGELTWPIIQSQVHRIFTVTEAEIIAAMKMFWQRTKLLIEPSSAVAVAVVVSAEFKELTHKRNVGIILSGGNVNLDALPWSH